MASNKEVKNRETINIALDETKSTVRKTTDEAVKEIPRFTKAVNEYQQETIQATKDIADSFLDSQKEVIHSMQSLWVRTLKMYKIHICRIGVLHKDSQKIMQEQ